MAFNADHDCFYFRATKSLRPRRVSYRSSAHRQGWRTVFKGYASDADPEHPRYYRHVGFRGHFKRLEGRWFLSVLPTYYFTTDGRKPLSHYEELLKGIKKLEKNPSVMAWVVFFCEHLRGRPGELALTPDYPHLKLGELQRFSVPLGIEDRLWLPPDEDESEDADALASHTPEEGALFSHED
jgi:hypothetical protein